MTNFEIDISRIDDKVIREAIEKDTNYQFDNRPVPRVSNIIRSMSDQSSLIQWAARVGYRRYNMIRENALATGTLVHEMIDHYLLHQKYDDFSLTINDESVNKAADIAFNNFLKWEAWLNQRGYRIEEVVGIEIPVITPFYGGTIDAIFRINGCYYIIDFKTSKQISTEYLLQVSAYLYGVNNGYCSACKHVDGIGIIRIDKRQSAAIPFEDYFLNLTIPYQNTQIRQFIDCFLYMCQTFYCTIECDHNVYDTSVTLDEMLSGLEE